MHLLGTSMMRAMMLWTPTIHSFYCPSFVGRVTNWQLNKLACYIKNSEASGYEESIRIQIVGYCFHSLLLAWGFPCKINAEQIVHLLFSVESNWLFPLSTVAFIQPSFILKCGCWWGQNTLHKLHSVIRIQFYCLEKNKISFDDFTSWQLGQL